MPSEPVHTLTLRALIYLGCSLLGFVALVLVGAAVDGPARAVVDSIAEQFGPIGLGVFLVALVGGLWWWAISGRRRDDRRQVADTGILDRRRPVIVREGLSRNLAILLAPLVVLAAIGLVFWLTGTPLPPAGPR